MNNFLTNMMNSMMNQSRKPLADFTHTGVWSDRSGEISVVCNMMTGNKFEACWFGDDTSEVITSGHDTADACWAAVEDILADGN